LLESSSIGVLRNLFKSSFAAEHDVRRMLFTDSRGSIDEEEAAGPVQVRPSTRVLPGASPVNDSGMNLMEPHPAIKTLQPPFEATTRPRRGRNVPYTESLLGGKFRIRPNQTEVEVDLAADEAVVERMAEAVMRAADVDWYAEEDRRMDRKE
jgi:hypothetical protein